MAYAPTHNFATDTVLEAGSGDPVVRLGVNDEIVAAYNDVTALVPAAFAAGTFRGAFQQTPRALSVQSRGYNGVLYPPTNGGFLVIWRPWVTLLAWAAPTDVKVHRLIVGLWGYMIFARDAKVTCRLKNPINGSRICRDIRIGRDFSGARFQGDSTTLVAPTTKRWQVGGDEGDSPLFISDLKMGDIVYVTFDWSHLFAPIVDHDATPTDTAGDIDPRADVWQVVYPIIPDSAGGRRRAHAGEWTDAAGEPSAVAVPTGNYYQQRAGIERPSVELAWSAARYT